MKELVLMPLPWYSRRSEIYCVAGSRISSKYRKKPNEIIGLVDSIYRPLVKNKSFWVGYDNNDIYRERCFIISKEDFVKIKLKYDLNLFLDGEITFAKEKNITFCKRKLS